MTMRTVLAITAAIALAGCDVGGVDSSVTPVNPTDPNLDDLGPGDGPLPDVTPEQARGLFDTNVAPIMEAKCAGAGGACHVGTAAFPPPFLGTGPLNEYYPALEADAAVNGNFQVASARLLLKLQAGPHQGVTYETAETQAIADWLNAELAARNPGEVPDDVPPPVVANVLAQWSGCMNLQDWNEANMGSWANKNAEGDNCQACHGGRLARFDTNPDNAKMFEGNRHELLIGGFFAVQVDPVTGQSMVVPAFEKLVYMGDGVPGNLHPRYNVNLNDQYFQRLQEFYDLTLARVNEPGNPRCGPAQFPAELPPL